MKRYIFSMLMLFAMVLPLSCVGCHQVATNSIIGKWARLIETEDVAFAAVIEFKIDNIFVFSVIGEAHGHTNTSGRYSATRGRLFIFDDDCESDGFYGFSIDNGTLSLAPVNDACRARREVLEGLWKRPDNDT